MLANVKAASIKDGASIAKIANKIVALGLATPAVFILEAHKPLAGLFNSLLIMGEPLAKPLIGGDRLEFLKEFSADKEKIEQLIVAIEQQASGEVS